MTRRPLISCVPCLWAACLAATATCRGSDARLVDRIFGSWVASQGGLGAQTQVASYAIEEVLEVQAATKTKTETRILRTRAGHFRIELGHPGEGAIVFGFDGDIGWRARASTGFSLAPVARNDPMVWENDLLIGLELVPANTRHSAGPGEIVNGMDCVVATVDVFMPEDETCYFERATRRLVRIVRPLQAAGTKPRRMVIDIGDYRPSGKIWVPYLVSVDDGTSVVTHRRSSVVVNPQVDEGSFVLSTAQVEEAAAVDRILGRQFATLGTPAAFANVHSRVTHLSVQSPTTGMSCKQVISLKSPNLVVCETQTPGMGREIRGFDGKRGWFSSEIEGNRPLQDAELKQLVYSTNINQLGQLAALCPFRQLMGERLVNGRKADAVALAEPQGPAATFYFDRESGRLVRISFSTKNAPSGDYRSTVDFSDFRVVDGVEVPFFQSFDTPLMKTVSIVESVQNNVVLDDAIFRQRQDD